MNYSKKNKTELRHFIAAVLMFYSVQLYPQNKDFLEVTITGKEGLRELSQKYFGDPNQWKLILTYNNLESPLQIKDGAVLKIPAGLYTSLLQKTAKANDAIEKATDAGAKVFFESDLKKATDILGKSKEAKNNARLKEASDLADESAGIALKVFEQTTLKRNKTSDATITFKKGDVQKKAAIEPIWSDADLYAKLFEQDRARTLSSSLAEITFYDLSRIRLNENSQAVIQKSRIDLLKKKTESTVKLVKGDAFAYLLQNPKKKFDIDVPGLKANIKSRSFWVEKNEQNTKIANYEGEIELTAKNTSVVVKENQGSIVPTSGVPSPPKDLLAPPGLVEPLNQSVFYTNKIQFKWNSIPGAKYYWFEIALDTRFKKIESINKTVSDTKIEISSLNPGVYYWHIATIDDAGFPGKFGKYNYFTIIKDKNKPYLIINSPSDYFITKKKELAVKGETEPDLPVKINDRVIIADANGAFKEQIELNEGVNKISFTVTDKALNETGYIRNVICELNPDVQLHIEKRELSTPVESFILTSKKANLLGLTRPLSEILIKSSSGQKTVSYADTVGAFNIHTEIMGTEENIELTITTPAGFIRTQDIQLLVKQITPIIQFKNPLPQRTNQTQLQLEGTIINSDRLFINNEEAPIQNGGFSKSLTLSQGMNSITFSGEMNAKGNVLEQKIFLDQNPPELVTNSVKVETKKDVIFLQLSLTAKDESDLKKTAVAVLKTNGEDKSFIMKLNESTMQYTVDLSLIKGNIKELVLKSFILEDQLGNNKEYEIQKPIRF